MCVILSVKLLASKSCRERLIKSLLSLKKRIGCIFKSVKTELWHLISRSTWRSFHFWNSCSVACGPWGVLLFSQTLCMCTVCTSSHSLCSQHTSLDFIFYSSEADLKKVSLLCCFLKRETNFLLVTQQFLVQLVQNKGAICFWPSGAVGQTKSSLEARRKP